MKKGFTLIELLLYVTLSGTMLLVISGFLGTMLEARVKNQTIAEVEQQGIQVMHMITQTIRNGDSITSPSTGTSDTSTTIGTTVYDLAAGKIHIKEGAGANISLTNSNITASSLLFENLSGTSTTGVVRISFTLDHTNPSGRNEFEFGKTFYSSASIRP